MLINDIKKYLPRTGATAVEVCRRLNGFFINCSLDDVRVELRKGARLKYFRVDYSTLPPKYFPKKEAN